jgi:hypothetical protein
MLFIQQPEAHPHFLSVILSFTYSLNKYLLATYYVLGTVLKPGGYVALRELLVCLILFICSLFTQPWNLTLFSLANIL